MPHYTRDGVSAELRRDCLRYPPPRLDSSFRRDINAGCVGIYVPGGTAVLPSTTLMLAVPAQLAGCATIVMATPPRPDGSITPEARLTQLHVTCAAMCEAALSLAVLCWCSLCRRFGSGPSNVLRDPAQQRPLGTYSNSSQKATRKCFH